MADWRMSKVVVGGVGVYGLSLATGVPNLLSHEGGNNLPPSKFMHERHATTERPKHVLIFLPRTLMMSGKFSVIFLWIPTTTITAQLEPLHRCPFSKWGGPQTCFVSSYSRIEENSTYYNCVVFPVKLQVSNE